MRLQKKMFSQTLGNVENDVNVDINKLKRLYEKVSGRKVNFNDYGQDLQHERLKKAIADFKNVEDGYKKLYTPIPFDSYKRMRQEDLKDNLDSYKSWKKDTKAILARSLRREMESKFKGAILDSRASDDSFNAAKIPGALTVGLGGWALNDLRRAKNSDDPEEKRKLKRNAAIKGALAAVPGAMAGAALHKSFKLHKKAKNVLSQDWAKYLLEELKARNVKVI